MEAALNRNMLPMDASIITRMDALLAQRHAAVEAWFEQEFTRYPAPVYSSVDVRHSGHKLAAVDTNLFPAGFNNLSRAARARAADALAGWIKEQMPTVRRVLLVPENHTRNLGYLDNVATLLAIFANAGLDVKLAAVQASETGETLELQTLTGQALTVPTLLRDGHSVRPANAPADWQPDLVFLNNDLTAGIPAILQGLAIPVVPALTMGWHRRRKTEHFKYYADVVADFAASFDLDPWLLRAEYAACGGLNFKERQGLQPLADAVDAMIARIAERYAYYGITSAPYVFIKADGGTYGMGIMTAHSGAEVLEINKKARNKMSVIKEGAEVSEVLVQEGVPTVDMVDGAVAEPVIYLVGGHGVGGAYRVNDARDAYGNLNATGMRFAGMCEPREQESEHDKVSITPCNYNVFSLVARLASLAAAREAAAV